MSTETNGAFEGWAILELMGHRRLGGYLRNDNGLWRIDIPDPDPEKPNTATQWYGTAAIYCITATTEAMARAVAARNQPAPVQAWELKQLPAPEIEDADDDEGRITPWP